MNVEEALKTVSRQLQTEGVEEPRLDSEYLVAAALNVPRSHLILSHTQALSQETEALLQRLCRERAARKPLAYVLGEQPFGDLSLSVNPSVLVPRPETEGLVEEAKKILDQCPNSIVVADVGTGSGNIALSLASHPNVSRVFGIDISEKALVIARENAKRCPGGEKCEWRQGDLLTPLQESVRLVIANLPYVRSGDIEGLAPELRWEPRLALDGGIQGLDLIFRLIQQAQKFLIAGSCLMLEIGHDQWDDVRKALESSGLWTGIQLKKDLAGWPRVVSAVRKG